MPGVPGTRKQILLNALVSVPTTLFQQTLSDSFTRADSSFGGAGSSSGGGNGWIDVNGGVAKIVSNKLSLTGDSVNTSQYLRDFVVRPTNEAFKDGRLEFDTLASTWNPSGNVSAHLRHQSGSNNNYLAKIKCDGTDLQIYSVVAGTPSLVAGGGSISGFSNSKAYRIRFECYGTQLLLTVFDVSGGTPVSVGAIQGVSSAISLAGVAGVGPQWGVLGASHSIHNLNISARKNISIGIISDSILANTPTGAPYSTGEALVRSIADRVGKTYTISNQGVAGRTSTDWLPGPNLNAAKAAFVTAGVTDVFLHVGSNDAVTTTLLNLATYLSNLSAITNDLVSGGYRVHLLGCIYALSGSAGPRDFRSNDLMKAYNDGLASISNGSTIMVADTSAFEYMSSNPMRFLDGIHPDKFGMESLASIWANASYGNFVG